jgi:UDP-N-acetyl-D-mannosaminuronic acid dehydrogenase
MTNDKTVTVVGLGYVGLPSAALMANAGYQVHGVDIDDRILDALARGQSPINEEEVVDVIEKALASGQLTSSKVPQAADVFIICVPTPVNDDKSPDLSMVRAAAKSVAPFVKPGNLVILESTSPINTTRDVIGGVLREVGLDPLADIDLCYCPERVFPGATVSEIIGNDRVVGGMTEKAALRAKRFYEFFCDGEAIPCSASGAEFSKLMENTYRDINIALANVFADIAEAAGVDVAEVISMANRHPRVNVHTPGPGVGGHCIPVDPWFLIAAYPGQAGFLKMARLINDGRAEQLLDRAEANGLARGSKVAVLGAAYRGDIDDARDTPTDLMLKVLNDRGYTWAVHDPHVERFKSHFGLDAGLTKDLGSAVEGAAVAFLMTDHSVYRDLAPNDFNGMDNKLVVDTRRLLDPAAMAAAGLTLISVGAPS